MQGRRLGEQLLRHALTLAVDLKRSLGCVGVVVDAKADSLTFYERYGFTQITELPNAGYPAIPESNPEAEPSLARGATPGFRRRLDLSNRCSYVTLGTRCSVMNRRVPSTSVSRSFINRNAR